MTAKVNQLSKLSKYNGLGTEELYRLADSEAIADCCETMLQNTKLFDNLLNVNRSFAERLVNAIKKIAANLRNFFKENPLEAKTEYGQALLEAMNKVENRVQDLWDKAVAEGIRADKTESGKVSFNERGNINSNDIIILRSIGCKSVFNFTSEDINKSEKWARKFYKELGEKNRSLELGSAI